MVTYSESGKIYLVISQTGTILSRIVKTVTGDRYNHVSIALDDRLENMYSFGRINPYNPVHGGFVRESRDSGTFRRFTDTECMVIEVSIETEKYRKITEELRRMYIMKDRYHYNYAGLVMAMFGKKRAKENCYYCSEFVYSILKKYGIDIEGGEKAVIKPINLAGVKGGRKIYEGRLQNFNRYSYGIVVKNGLFLTGPKNII